MADRFTGVVSGRTFQMLLLTVVASSAAYARTSISPLQETMRAALGLTDNQIALLQGPAMALPMIILAVPLGLLIDRRPRVRLLIGLATLDWIGGVLTAFAHTFAMLFVSRCIVGLTAFAIPPVVLSLIADLYSPTQRGRATMVMTIGQFAGASLVFALGGSLLAMWGPGPNGWRWTMLLLSALLVPVLLLALFIREPRRSKSLERRGALKHAMGLWDYRALFLPLLSGVVIVEIALCASLIWAGPALARDFQLSPERVGSIMAVVLLLSGVLGTFAGGFLVDFAQRSGGPRRTLRVLTGLAAVSLPAGLFAVMPGAMTASALLLLFVSTTSAICVVGTTLATVVIPAHLRGLCLTLLFTCGAIFGVGLAPIAVSSLAELLGGPLAIGVALPTVCASASLLSVIILLLSRRGFDRAVVACSA